MSPFNHNYECILLDLDGTLVESPQRRFLLYNTWALYKRFVKLFGLIQTVPIVKKAILSMLNNSPKSGLKNFEILVKTCSKESNLSEDIIISELNPFYQKDFFKMVSIVYASTCGTEFC